MVFVRLLSAVPDKVMVPIKDSESCENVNGKQNYLNVVQNDV